MRTPEQIRAVESFAVAAKETATSDRTHAYAEGVQDALAWASGDEDEIDGIDYREEDQ